MNFKKKAATVIGFTVFIILVIGFVLGIFFFGFAGIFELLGVQYHSIWSLIIFVISFFFLGFFVDLIFGAMAKLSTENIKGNVKVFLIQLLFGFVSNWLVLFVVDAFMHSISLSLGTIIIIAFLLGMIEAVFDDKKAHNKPT